MTKQESFTNGFDENIRTDQKNMKSATDWNLDDPNEVEEFISTFGTMKGRGLANRLSLEGKGSVALANNLSAYAWNKSVAMKQRLKGNITVAKIYEDICDKVYSEIPEPYRW